MLKKYINNFRFAGPRYVNSLRQELNCKPIWIEKKRTISLADWLEQNNLTILIGGTKM